MMSKLKKMDPIFLKCESHVIQNILTKASKNHIKMVQHLMRIGAKMAQNQGLEGVWGAFGRLWEALGRLLAPRHLCAASLAPFWAAFRQLLERLGRLLGASWAVLGTKLGRPGASWRHFGGLWLGFFTLRVLLYLRLSILVDFWIQNT